MEGDDIGGWRATLPLALVLLSLASLVVAPIVAHRRMGGLLTGLLVALALLSAALVVRLGREYRVLARRLGARLSEQAALREVSSVLSASVSVREVVEAIAERAVATTHASGAYVERADTPEAGTEVEVVAIAGVGVPPLGTRIPYPGSLSAEIIESGDAEIIAEIGVIGERMAPYLRASCRGCSGLVVPLTAEGSTLGALVLLRRVEQPPFTREEAAHARVLGDLASASLRRVLLMEREREARAEVTTILESITDAFFALDREWRFTYVNQEAERVLMKSREELMGRNVWEEFPEAAQDTFAREYHRAVEEQTAVEFEEFYRPFGRWLNVRAYPTDAGLSVFFRDVTTRKLAEAERERLHQREREARADAERRQEELERVTESRARLMRGFSHDVKNPLSAADSYAQLLEDGILGALSWKQRESVERIRRSIHASLRLIHELLELARVEAGQLEIECVPTDIARAAREVAEDFRAQAEAAGLALEVRLPEPLRADTDPVRIRQVLGNLLSNAVKYTSEGRVAITTELRRNGEGPRPGSWVAVRVTDTGPGIPEEQREKIFQEFTRLDPDAPHGAGVGLAISRRIARMLGGDITVESEEGRGSGFTLWLPGSEP